MFCEYHQPHEDNPEPTEPTWWEHDARGIPLAKVCEHCVDKQLSKYRPEVLSNPNYWADEPIEET